MQQSVAIVKTGPQKNVILLRFEKLVEVIFVSATVPILWLNSTPFHARRGRNSQKIVNGAADFKIMGKDIEMLLSPKVS